MFIPIVSDGMKATVDGNQITIEANFGLSFRNKIDRLLNNSTKAKALFLDYGLWKIRFYTFFIPEVIGLLSRIKKDKHLFKINIVVIEDVIKYLNEFTYQNSNYQLDLKAIEENMKFKIMEHQKPIFERYQYFKQELMFRGMLLDAGPGTGKTFSSLALSEALHSDRVYIICPLPTVKEVWENSLAGGGCVYNKPQEYYTMKSSQPYKGEKFVIIHYEALDRALEIFRDYNNNLSQVTVIIDESHNLASSISRRTTNAIEFVDMVKANDVFCLSGTPLKSSFKELGVIFKLLDGRFQGVIEDKFYQLYKSPNDFLSEMLTSRYRGISVKVHKDSIKLEPPITNYINIKLKNGDKYTLKNVRKELKEFVARRKKELDDMAPEVEKRYYELYELARSVAGSAISEREAFSYFLTIDKIRANDRNALFLMPDKIKEANQFEAKLAQYLKPHERKEWNEIKTIYKYPILKIQGEALGLVVTRARINCHADLAAALNYQSVLNTTTKKTLIFSSYVDVCKAAFTKSKKDGYDPIGVYGETVGQLDSSVKKFSTSKKINPLIASYKSLSTGVPLIAANVIICLDLPFRMYTYDQAISRVWRLGQDQQVYVYILALDTGEEPNINGRNVDIITFFKEEIEKITGYKAGIDLDKNLSGSAEDIDFYNHGVLQLSRSNCNTYGIFTKWS